MTILLVKAVKPLKRSECFHREVILHPENVSQSLTHLIVLKRVNTKISVDCLYKVGYDYGVTARLNTFNLDFCCHCNLCKSPFQNSISQLHNPRCLQMQFTPFHPSLFWSPFSQIPLWTCNCPVASKDDSHHSEKYDQRMQIMRMRVKISIRQYTTLSSLPPLLSTTLQHILSHRKVSNLSTSLPPSIGSRVML